MSGHSKWKPFARGVSPEFDGWEFAAGEVYGMRAWRYGIYYPNQQKDDVLVGAFNQAWPTGKGHEATCQASKFLTHADGEHEPHEAPAPGCRCGFYAYFDPNTKRRGGHLFYEGMAVSGVIRGYGRVVIGTHGFRCEKADIVALAPSDFHHDHLEAARMAVDRWGRDTYVPYYRPGSDYVQLGELLLEIEGEYARALNRTSDIADAYGAEFFPDVDEMLAHHPLSTEYLEKKSDPGGPPPALRAFQSQYGGISLTTDGRLVVTVVEPTTTDPDGTQYIFVMDSISYTINHTTSTSVATVTVTDKTAGVTSAPGQGQFGTFRLLTADSKIRAQGGKFWNEDGVRVARWTTYIDDASKRVEYRAMHGARPDGLVAAFPELFL